MNEWYVYVVKFVVYAKIFSLSTTGVVSVTNGKYSANSCPTRNIGFARFVTRRRCEQKKGLFRKPIATKHHLRTCFYQAPGLFFILYNKLIFSHFCKQNDGSSLKLEAVQILLLNVCKTKR